MKFFKFWFESKEINLYNRREIVFFTFRNKIIYKMKFTLLWLTKPLKWLLGRMENKKIPFSYEDDATREKNYLERSSMKCDLAPAEKSTHRENLLKWTRVLDNIIFLT